MLKFFITAILILYGTNLFACDCRKKLSVKKSYQVNICVFEGECIGVNKNTFFSDSISYTKISFDGFIEYSFIVKKVFKGSNKVGDTIRIYSPQLVGMCGFKFLISSMYLVYGNNQIIRNGNQLEEVIHTHSCSRTKLTSNDKVFINEQRYLRKLAKKHYRT